MSVWNVEALRHDLPEVFEPVRPPPGLDESWDTWTDTDPDDGPTDADIAGLTEAYPPQLDEGTAAPVARPRPELPEFPGHTGAGAPRHEPWSTPQPPIEALAFYLPFHVFPPRWWGIYLTVEGVIWVRDAILRSSHFQVPVPDATRAAHHFLYGHEVFHHDVESFATKLEMAHREPLYVRGFRALFRRVYLKDECLEEGLANANGINRAVRKTARPYRELVRDALCELVRDSPPGYSRGEEFAPVFTSVRGEMAEAYHAECFPKLKRVSAQTWGAHPHAFGGLSRATSRVNYLIPRRSPLWKRKRLTASP